MTKPETSAVAAARLQKLIAEKGDHERLLRSGKQRRKEHAFKASQGDGTAKAALTAIEDEEAAARNALLNIDLAIEESQDLLNAANQREREQDRIAQAEARSEAIDELLALDDEIDAALQRARDLLLERRARVDADGHLLGAANEHRIRETLSCYFDLYWPGMQHFGEIVRVAEHDGAAFGRVSDGVAERGPRPPSVLERILQREVGFSQSDGRSIVRADGNRATPYPAIMPGQIGS